jgi:FkbM family methyltransferase
MKISYAQRLEDYHLDQVFRDIAKGTYVDIGGGHPVADNVSFHFYLKGWHGLIVEPQAKLADLYSHVRPRDITLQTLVGRTVGEVTFHQVEGMHGFSTTVADNARTAEGYGARVEAIPMPMTTLARIAADQGLSSVDFLKIDVEGAEADVLAGNNWKRFRPRVIVIEAVAPGTMAPAWGSWEPDLSANGYRFAFFDDLNRFYVADEAAHLMGRFPPRPAPWDAAEHPWDYGRADANPKHPDHALARHLVRGLMAIAPSLGPAMIERLLEAGGALEGTPAEIAARLRGTADHPATDIANAAPLGELLDSDRVRAALGRIAAAYDGGFIIEE